MSKPESKKELTEQENEDLAALTQLKAKSVINEAIEQIKSEYGVTYTPETVRTINNIFLPVVTALGPEYIEANKEMLTKSLSSSLKKGQGFISRVMGKYDYIDIKYVAEQFNKKYQPLADSYQIQYIEDSLLGVSNTKLAEKLTELGVEKAKTARCNTGIGNLVGMSQENPELFDKIVLKRNETALSRQEIVDGIIDQAVDKMGKAFEPGSPLALERELLKKECKQALAPVFSKLSLESLAQYSEAISSDLTYRLTYEPFLPTFNTNEDRARALTNVSKHVLNYCTRKAMDRIKEKISSLSPDELEQRLTALAVEKAKTVKFNPNELSPEALVKIRKENPAMFDSVVLGIGKEEVAAKTVVAAPVKEKAQEIASPSLSSPPLQSSPLLSEHNSSPPKEVTVASVQKQQEVTTAISSTEPRRNASTSQLRGGVHKALESLAAAFRELVTRTPPPPSPSKGSESSQKNSGIRAGHGSSFTPKPSTIRSRFTGKHNQRGI